MKMKMKGKTLAILLLIGLMATAFLAFMPATKATEYTTVTMWFSPYGSGGVMVFDAWEYFGFGYHWEGPFDEVPVGDTLYFCSWPLTGHNFAYYCIEENGQTTYTTADPYTKTVSGPFTITAYFDKYSLTVSWGTGGQANLAPGTFWYDSGAQVQLTAYAYSGYAFDYWLVNGQANYNQQLTLTMNTNYNVQPVFQTQNWYYLTVSTQRAYGGPVYTAIKIDGGTWYPAYGGVTVQLPAGQHTVEAYTFGIDIYYNCDCYFTAFLDGYWHYENPMTIDLEQDKGILANYFA
jgi:hypothetical protein